MGEPGGRVQNLTRKGKGRPKGALNKSTRAKEEYFSLFFKKGGKKFLEQLLDKSIHARSKFLLHTLPSLMPKKTETKADGPRVIVMDYKPIQKPPNSGLSQDD